MAKVGAVLITILKRVVLAFCFIYGFDFIATGLNIFIPLNVVTISLVSILGLPGLLALMGVYFILV